MKSEDRRESILDAATQVFGDLGYVGTTTDAVAKASGVSQPYVVRMFGTKQTLFSEVLQRALDAMLATFRAAIAGTDDLPVETRIGFAYAELAAERKGIVLSLMHAFVLGSDPVIGPAARRGFLEVYSVLRDEAGLTPEEATGFLAGGMLMNTLIGLRMPIESDPIAGELVAACFGDKVLIAMDSDPKE